MKTRTHMHAFPHCDSETLDRLERLLASIETAEYIASANAYVPPPSPWDDMSDADIVASCRAEV